MSFQKSIPQQSIVTDLETMNPVLHRIKNIIAPIIEKLELSATPVTRGRQPLPVSIYISLAIYKIINGLTFRRLASATQENISLRMFADITHIFRISKSTLQEQIALIDTEILLKINTAISEAHADFSGVRLDSSAVAANIAPPENNNLLYSAVARVAKIMSKFEQICEQKIFSYLPDASVAKRLSYEIRFSNPKTDEKIDLYTRLTLHVGHLMDNMANIINEALQAIEKLTDTSAKKRCNKYVDEMSFMTQKISCVISQTIGWLHGEIVAAGDKLFSVAKDMEHVDIIIKDRRKVVFGHKFDIVESRNGLIIGFFLYEGNPSDASNLLGVVDTMRKIYGSKIDKLVMDGGYNSRENLEKLNELGVSKAVFTRKRSLTLDDMGVTPEEYQEDKNFRSGVERAISRLKRSFGFEKLICTTSQRFYLYLVIGVVAANLCTVQTM